MAYSELIKDFERIRDYMRQFYIYGFKSRDEYDQKSARSYDNERRRIESWLGDYMRFHRSAGGKNVFLSVDSRVIPANPLYSALKARSFTAGDITFHFYILDLLEGGAQLTIREIADAIADDYLSCFDSAEPLDESTLRKKLKEYAALGLLKAEKRGRELVYSRNDAPVDLTGWAEALTFYSEAAPLGIVGSQLLDKLDALPDPFRFKHHYMLQALDSTVLSGLLALIRDRRRAHISAKSSRRSAPERSYDLVPMKIFVSVQSGRQYLLGWREPEDAPAFVRMDSIRSVKDGGPAANRDELAQRLQGLREGLWGVSLNKAMQKEHIEMTLRISEDENFIIDRLKREKRCGRVEQAGAHSWRFSADVWDAQELLPWIRSFTGRIERLECSNPRVTQRFFEDMQAMLAMYGGEDHALS